MDKEEYKTRNYLQKLFKAYYKSKKGKNIDISSFKQREFAFTTWKGRGMRRHIGYPDKNYLVDFLSNQGPRNCYRSAAHYEKPGASTMDQKDYIKCDLVFDIDSDHIPTPCREKHNYFFCKECGKEYQGEKPKNCSKCNGKKFEEIVWICEDCLRVSKEQVYKLVDRFLTQEFAIDREEIKIFFSGHRGYHAQIEEGALLKMDSEARREIIDYITGNGLSFNFWGFKKTQGNMLGFTPEQLGWPGKIANKFLHVLNRTDQEIRDYFSHPTYEDPISTNFLDILIQNKRYLTRNLMDGNSVWQIKGIGEATWKSVFNILRDDIKADVDVVVSYDLHRLIRMEGSMHGKSGFMKVKIPYAELSGFDPLKDALSFPHNEENTINIKITSKIAPEIRIGDNIYGPFEQGDHAKLPLNAGLFYLCKMVAVVEN